MCTRKRRALSVGLVGNAPKFFPNCCAAASYLISSPIKPARTIRSMDMFRHGMTLDEAADLFEDAIPSEYIVPLHGEHGRHVQAMLGLQRGGSVVFDYGNNIRMHAVKAGVDDAFDFPGFVPEYIRPLFCEGTRSVPMGCAFGRSRRYSRDGRVRSRSLS